MQARFKLGVQEASPAEKAAGSEAITHSDRLALVEDGQVIGFFRVEQRGFARCPGRCGKSPRVARLGQEPADAEREPERPVRDLAVAGWILIRMRNAPERSDSLRFGAATSGALA